MQAETAPCTEARVATYVWRNRDFSLIWACIVALSYQLSATPDHLQSRVGTAFKLIAWSSFPLGAAIAGVLLDRFGPAVTNLVFGGWVFAIALFATVHGGLRKLADPGDHSS